MSTESFPCYLCGYVAGRKDHLKVHYRGVHRRSIDNIVNGTYGTHNGIVFKRLNPERPSLLFSLKAHGSSIDCGLCFDCCSGIFVGIDPRPKEYIASHVCRKRIVYSTPVAPASAPPLASASVTTDESVFESARKQAMELTLLARNIKESINFYSALGTPEEQKKVSLLCAGADFADVMLSMTHFHSKLKDALTPSAP